MKKKVVIITKVDKNYKAGADPAMLKGGGGESQPRMKRGGVSLYVQFKCIDLQQKRKRSPPFWTHNCKDYKVN